MKVFLLVAAIHILIIYQAQKKHGDRNSVLPEPAGKPTPAIKGGQPVFSLLQSGFLYYPGFFFAAIYAAKKK